MATSFPNSIKAFTTLVDGSDLVLASHQNDANQEITAIETYLFDAAVGVGCGGRLSLSTDPAPTTDITGATVLYYEPYVSDQIGLYITASTDWAARTFSELSLSLVGYSASDNVDIFIYDDSGTPTMEGLPWTDATTRAAAISRLNGVLVETTDYTRRYVGTVHISSSSDCADSATQRFVWNMYNRLPANLSGVVCDTLHTFATTDWREVNAGVGVTRYEFVTGLPQIIMLAGTVNTLSNSGTAYGQIGIAMDTVTSYTVGLTLENTAPSFGTDSYAFMPVEAGVGYHYLTFTEINGSAEFYFSVATMGSMIYR